MSTILVADDEAALLETLSEILIDLGHIVLAAHDGDEALALARANLPDVIVSDYMMPGRNGLELFRALRQDEKLQQIPFILMSAAQPSLCDGVWRYLPKPLTLDTLESAINEASAVRPNGDSSDATSVAAPVDTTASSQLREEMLNWVAHEIKTPLGAARLKSEVLARQLLNAGNPEQAERVRSIIRQLDRMGELVAAVLDAAQIANSKLKLDIEVGDLSALLVRLVSDWTETAPQVTFTLDKPAEPVMMAFDAVRLRHVLDNLVSNAVKYGAPANRVEVVLENGPSSASIRVTDHGPGIAAAELPRIFDRFHRAEGSAGQGHGLGLYIAAALTRLHNGALRARSELGQGATFIVTLPHSSR